MTPPCYTFPAAELQERVQLDVHGRQRKMLPGSPAPVAVSGKPGVDGKLEKDERPGHLGIDLARDCTLLSSMVQYSCAVMHPEMRDSPVRCWPVQRMFRKCQDRHGSFMVETTAWEGMENASRIGGEESLSGSLAKDSASETATNVPSASASTAASIGAGPSKKPETLRVFG